MEPTTIAIIIAVYFIAAFYGSIVGGGGLIAVPTLIFAGLSPHSAIATARIGGVGIGTGGALGYLSKIKIDYKFGLIYMIFAVIGAIIGTFIVLAISEELIEKIIGIIILAISGILFFNKDFGAKTRKVKRSMYLVAFLGICTGIYAGFYGAGLGIINRFIFSAVFAFSIISSSALSTLMTIASSIFSLIIFTYYGLVAYSLVIPIFVTSLVGGYLGSKYAVKLGNEKVKTLLLAAAIIMAVKLVFF